MKKILLSIICAFPIFTFAQTNTATNPSPETQQWSNFIGVQSNLLLRQVLNISGSTATTNNPYLFTYSLINNKTGWGLSAGLGLNTSSSSNKDTSGTSVKNSQTNFALRIGAEKRWYLSPKWATTLGFDALYNNLSSHSETLQDENFEKIISTTDDKTNSFGVGIRGAISFAITPRIWIGTETNLSFLYGMEKVTSSTTFIQTGQPTITQSLTNKINSTSVTSNLPTAFFIIVKF